MGWLTAKPFIFACALLVVAGVVWRCMVPAVTDSDGKDFGENIISASIQKKDSAGNWVDITAADVLYPGNSIQVSIGYQLPQNFLATTNTITYQVKDVNVAISHELRGPVKDGQQNVGTYVISQDGFITIVFNDDYVEKNKNYAVSGTVAYEGSLSSSNQKEQDSTSSSKYGDVELSVTIGGTSDGYEHDVITKKGHTGLQKNEDGSYTVTYQITVSTTKGTGDTITLNDVLSGQHMEFNADSVTVAKAGSEDAVSFDKTVSGDNLGLVINGALSAGEEYVVTYTTTVGAEDVPDDSSDASYYNKVTASTDKAKDHSSDVTVKIYGKDAENKKYASWSDQNNKVIYWKAELNRNAFISLDGCSISDLMSFNNGPETAPDLVSGSVRLVKYYYDGTPSETIWDGLDSFGTDGKITEIGDNKDKGGYYILEYATSYADAEYGDDITVSNTITLNDSNGNEYGSTVGTTSVKNHVLGKTYNSVSSIAGDTDHKLINWEATIKGLKNNTILKGKIYKDAFGPKQHGTIDMFGLKLYDAYNRDVVAPDYYSVIYYKNGVEVETGEFDSFAITFNEDYQYASGNGLKISYNTIGDITELSDENSKGSVKFTNTADFNGDQATGECIYTPVVHLEKADPVSSEREDGYHTTGDLSAGDDIYLTYILRVRADNIWSGLISLEDVLPQGTEFAGIIEAGFYDTYEHANRSQWFDGIDAEQNPEISVTQKEGVVTFSVPETIYAGDENGSQPYGFFIKYRLKLTDDEKNSIFQEYDQVHIYKNSVSMRVESEEEPVGSDENEQGIVADLLDKHNMVPSGYDSAQGYYDATRQLDYEVIINPGAVMIGNSDTLALKDILSCDWAEANLSECYLVRDSLKLYEWDESRNDYVLVNAKDGDGKFNYTYSIKSEDGKHVLNMTVPNGKRLKLVYSYYIETSQKNYSCPISNSINLEGIDTEASTSDSEELTLDLTSSSATVSTGQLTIYKLDADNQLLMVPGAKFKLEMYDKDTNKWIPARKYNTTEGGTGIGTAPGEEFGTLVSDENGKLELNNLTFNKGYRLVETEAPEGYGRIADYYFYLYSTNQTTYPVSLPEDISVQKLTNSTADLLEPGAFVLKKIASDTEDVLSNAEYELYVYDEASEQFVKVTKDSADQAVNLVTGTNGTINLSNCVDYDKLYYIKEITAPDGYAVELQEHYFVLASSEKVEVTIPEGVSADEVTYYFAGDEMVMVDHPLEITVTKEWIKDGQVVTEGIPENIRVTLYKTQKQIGTSTVVFDRNKSQFAHWIDEINGVRNLYKNQSGLSFKENEKLILWFYNGEEYTDFKAENRGSGTATITSEPDIITVDGKTIHAVKVSVSYISGEVRIGIVQDPKQNGDTCPIIVGMAKENVAVSSSLGEKVETVELNAGNGWTKTWKADELDAGYYYYVLEEELSDYDAAYSVSMITSGDIRITNTFVDRSKTIEVEKKWYDQSGAEITGTAADLPDEVELTLYRQPEASGEPGVIAISQSGNLNNTGYNSGSWIDPGAKVPDTDKNVVYQNKSFDFLDDQIMTITTYDPEHILLNFYFFSNDGTDVSSITQTRTIDGDYSIFEISGIPGGTVNIAAGNTKDNQYLAVAITGLTFTSQPDYSTPCGTITVTKETGWRGSWKVYDDAQYIIKETPVSGYDTVITGDQNTGFVVENRKNGEETVSVTVEKKWVGTPKDSVTIKLMQRYGTEEWKEYRTVTLNSANQWTYTWTALPKYQDSEKTIPYVYTVKEVDIEGYTSEITVRAENSFLITNTESMQTTEVSITKKWEDADGNPVDVDHVTIVLDLLRNDVSLGSIEIVKENGSISVGSVTGDELTKSGASISVSEDWKVTVSGLPEAGENGDYAYAFKETAVKDASGPVTDHYAVRYETGFVINRVKPSVSIEKKWFDGDTDITETRTEGSIEVTFGRYISLNGTKKYDTGFEQVITLEAANSWKAKVEYLDLTDKDGNVYIYYVEEKNHDGYSVTYQIDGGNAGVACETELTSGNVNITVNNKSGYELPSTGGTGTYRYLWAGIALMLFAGLGYIMLQCNKLLVKSHSTKRNSNN